MYFSTLKKFLARAGTLPAGRPAGFVLAEDGIEVESTLAHQIALGFDPVVLLALDSLVLPAKIEEQILRVAFDTRQEGAAQLAMNAIIRALPNRWMHYCFNGEYLYYPFCEERSIRELTDFSDTERRGAIFTYVLDLYAGDLERSSSGTSRVDAHFDRLGYHAEQLFDPEGIALLEQYHLYGGLRRRFEEHGDWRRRRINRGSLFRSAPGLRIDEHFDFSDEAYNSYSSEWHHSVTAAVCSFRAAKALQTNPGAREKIDSFVDRNSQLFEWDSRQLCMHGFIEPGQWF